MSIAQEAKLRMSIDGDRVCVYEKSPDYDEVCFILLDENHNMKDVWYRRYQCDPEWTARCEEVIRDLFSEGEHIWSAIEKFNQRNDIECPAMGWRSLHDWNHIETLEQCVAAVA